MRFSAEMLDKSNAINHFVEFGFEDVGNVFPSDDVMYVKGIPVILSSVQVLIDDLDDNYSNEGLSDTFRQ